MVVPFIQRQVEKFRAGQEMEKIEYNTHVLANELIFGNTLEELKSSIFNNKLPEEPVYLVGEDKERYLKARAFIFRTYREIIAMEEGGGSSQVFNYFLENVLEYLEKHGQRKPFKVNESFDNVLLSGMVFQSDTPSSVGLSALIIMGLAFDTIRGRGDSIDLQSQVKNIPFFEKLIVSNGQFAIDALYNVESKLEI